MQPHANVKPENPRIILFGASVRAAAQAAQRAGFDVFGIDQFADKDMRAACSRFIKLGIRASQDESESRNSAQATADALTLANHPHKTVPWKLHDAVRVAQQAWRTSLLLRAGDVISDGSIPAGRKDLGQIDAIDLPGRAIKDPASLRLIAHAAGAAFPETWTEAGPNGSDPATSPTKPRNRKPLRWLIKPLHGSGGLGIRWFDPRKNPQPLLGDECVQAWIPGKAFGATFLGDGQQSRLLGICRSYQRRCVHQPFVYSGSSGPVRMNNNAVSCICCMAQIFVDRTSHRGLFNVDFIQDPKHRIHLLEINPRWSASMELIDGCTDSASKKSHLIQLHHMAVLGQTIDPIEISSHAVSRFGSIHKRVVYANRNGTFSAEKLEQLIRQSVTHRWCPRWSDIPHDGEAIQRGQPLITLTTTCPVQPPSSASEPTSASEKSPASTDKGRLQNGWEWRRLYRDSQDLVIGK